MIRKINIALLFVFLCSQVIIHAQDCNRWPLNRCIGNGLDFVKNKGQSAHFMNLKNNTILNSITTAMTVEMWIKADLELGKRNYFAGKWGPTEDKSDVWQLYYDVNNEIVFEINHPSSELKSVDNTIARSNPVSINGGWHHLAAVFDGSQAKAIIYLDGNKIAEATNPSYPISQLKISGNDTQFGRANEMSNSNSYRAFRGVMDEIKLWSRALPEAEIKCEKDKRRDGNEAGLIAYFRCNEEPGVYDICDATGNNTPILLSGLTTTKTKNNRPEYRPFIVSAPVQIDTIKCSTRKKYTITVTDTSLCGSRAYIWITPEFRKYFDYPKSYLTLPPKTPVTFEFYFDSDIIGTIKPMIRIIRDDLCGFDLLPYKEWQWSITRETEIKYDADTLGFGTLKAHCIEEPYRELTLKMCNNTASFGTPRDITVTGANFKFPQYYSVVSPAMPFTIKPGECKDLVVRFTSGSVASIFYDTLKIQSTDKCPGAGIIPLTGAVENIIKLTKYGTKDESLDSIDFGTICKDFPSNEALFYWENLSSENIKVVDVIVPNQFQFVRFNKTQPQTLEPQKSYQVKLIRFVPTQAGNFIDTVFIIVKAGGCTLRVPIIVKGRSIDPDLTFTVDTVDYGNVFVGQELEKRIRIRNNGDDEFTVSFSISRGDAFYFPAGRFATIPPKEEREVRVRFRPVSDSLYIDKLCFQETPKTGCYSSGCITLRGQGIINKFRFNPEIMKLDNVIACHDSTNELYIVNESPVELTLNSFYLRDPSKKFEILEPVADTNALKSYTATIPAGDSLKFKFRYTPNDLLNDRADKAFLDYTDEDGEDWAAFLQASSTLPKLFMEDNNAFGTVEVGLRPTKEIILENISSIPVLLDSLSIGSNFNILYPSKVVNRLMQPRDTIHIVVEFVPTAAVSYTTKLISYSNSPCPIQNEASFSGIGKVIPIEIINTLVTFGFVKSCDCQTAEITMSNNSKVNDAVIDSMWIDGVGIVGPAYPQYFSWSSKFAPNSNELPYKIPPLSKDTVSITYCPHSPSIRDSLNHSALLHIDAHGQTADGTTEVWRLEKPYDRFLAGRQMLMYEPEPLVTQFPATLVNNYADPQFLRITIPGIDYNPDRETIVIDSITFEPQEYVFFASDSLGRPYPITYTALEDTLMIRVDFKPRVYRDYSAKVKIHFAEPCEGIDTTLLVTGSGFATPFTMPFDFKTATDTITQYQVISCDTLLLPVYATRQVPADLIDIDCQIKYDTSLFQYIGQESPYIGYKGEPENSICSKYNTNVNIVATDSSTLYVKLENFCEVDSVKPLFIAKFKPRVNQTISSTFVLDSFKFDSKDVILFRLIPDRATIDVQILNSDVSILNDINYDTVNVLDCKIDTFMVQNTGDVPFLLSNIINLPPDVTILSITPPLTDTLYPSEITEVVLEFCPRQVGEYSSYSSSEIFDPCYMLDSNLVSGFGYAPPYELLADVSTNFSIPDTLFGAIGDTVFIPIFIDKDVMASYKGIEHWMVDMFFNINIDYNPASLKFLGVKSLNEQANFSYNLIKNGNLKLEYSDLDTLRAMQIAELKMLVVLPIDTTTSIDVTIDSLGSEYIYFLDLYSNTENNLFNTGKSCQISHIINRLKPDGLKSANPNPWSEQTIITMELTSQSSPILKLYDVTGKLAKVLLNGNKVFEKGIYDIRVYSNNLLPGKYFYTLETNGKVQVKQMILLK